LRKLTLPNRKSNCSRLFTESGIAYVVTSEPTQFADQIIKAPTTELLSEHLLK